MKLLLDRAKNIMTFTVVVLGHYLFVLFPFLLSFLLTLALLIVVGSHAAQTARFRALDKETRAKIPNVVLKAFGINASGQTIINARKLYSHQARAISSALNDQHTMVCTSTGRRPLGESLDVCQISALYCISKPSELFLMAAREWKVTVFLDSSISCGIHSKCFG